MPNCLIPFNYWQSFLYKKIKTYSIQRLRNTLTALVLFFGAIPAAHAVVSTETDNKGKDE